MRRKKQVFTDPKMLSSRVERADYSKFDMCLIRDRLSVQDFLNKAVVSYISGAIILSGSNIIGVTATSV